MSDPLMTGMWAAGHLLHVLTVVGMLVGAVLLAVREEPGSGLRAGLLGVAALLHGVQMAAVIVAFELPYTLFDLLDALLLYDWFVLALRAFNGFIMLLASFKWALLTAAVFTGRTASPSNRG